MAGFSGLIPFAVNFSVVAVFIYFIGSKQLRKIAYQRYTAKKELVENTKAEEKDAERRLREMEQALEGIDAEVGRIHKKVEERTAAKVQVILEKAREESKRLDAGADGVIKNEYTTQEQAIYLDLLGRVVREAKDKIPDRLGSDGQLHLVKEAISKVEGRL